MGVGRVGMLFFIPPPSLHSHQLLLLGHRGVGNNRRVGHLLAQLVEHLLAVLVKTTVDLGDALLLNHPQLAVGLTNQPLVVGNNNDAT